MSIRDLKGEVQNLIKVQCALVSVYDKSGLGQLQDMIRLLQII